MSTVVVTGASGFVGQGVVSLLGHGRPVARGSVDRVIGLDLVPGIESQSRRDGTIIEHRVIDLARDPTDRLDAVLEGADSVLHLAWSYGEASTPPSRHDQPVLSSNLRSLRRVLDAADRAGIRGFVHLSSATVYGAWPDNPVPLPEDAVLRPNPGFIFAVEKAEAERMIAEWADEHRAAAVVVLRPTVTVGAATVGSAGPALYQALAGTRGPRPDDGGRPLQFLHVDDLAAAAVFAWDQQLQGVYNVAPDGWITEDQARALAGGVARVTLPGRLVRLLATVGWDLLRTGTPREAMPYSVHPWVIANDRLRTAGWSADYSNEEALVKSDDRLHWGDLPPSRRQEVALLAAAGAVIAAGGTLAA
ncbi:MAG TPA: NAD-dependent epimerase/dehydratase family protein, partial [Acidimicrobiales bacterium]|nr:NAD-dependent epimerase/dehydratase family protein [Acidimicrobiales bacterium]